MPAAKPRRYNGSVIESFRHGRYNVRDQLGHFVKHPRPTRASWFGSAASRRAHLAGRIGAPSTTICVVAGPGLLSEIRQNPNWNRRPRRRHGLSLSEIRRLNLSLQLNPTGMKNRIRARIGALR